MNSILKVRDLSKTYEVNEREHRVLNDVNMDVRKGEFISVMGPSGSGKSTLLYNVSGMDRMTEGEVTFDGTHLEELPEGKLSGIRLREMGFVFQQINLIKNLGIIDNIILSAYMANGKSRGEINTKAIDLMKKTGIAELADNDITQASGGQLQRAAICRALINDPKILFGDEPTGALNSSAASNIMDIIRNINEEGTTIMLVTHNVKVASQSERVLFLVDGKIDGEYKLGKFDKSKGDVKLREEELSEWLLEMGF